VVTWLIGDLLTGRRIQTVKALTGTWSEVLNDAGDVSCVVSLADRVNQRLVLRESATPTKTFLAAVDGDTVLQAGPIWQHGWDKDSQQLTITAKGMWSYFDHRVLLPVLGALNPSDPLTDTRYSPVISDPDDPDYPWATDTSKSLQGIARALVAQAQSWTGGNVPVILPAEIASDGSQRWYKGADLGIVSERLTQLTQVDGGPDIMFTPRLQADRQGVEWVMRIGTPTVPQLFSPQRQTFYIGNQKSSVSALKLQIDGSAMASQTFAAGGRTGDQTLITVSTDPTLPGENYPLTELVDSSHSTISDPAQLQAYSDEMAVAGRTPKKVSSFDHNLSQRPFLEAFNAGDFADLEVLSDSYMETGSHPMRIMSRAGDEQGRKVSLTFFPEVD